jgi:hypothetical protein
MNGSSQVCSVGGRVLILLTALLLAVMPWTEYLWHFDNFLHGGQDMELGLLSIVTIFCLVLVLLQDGKQRVTSMVVIRQWLSCHAPTRFLIRHIQPSHSSLIHLSGTNLRMTHPSRSRTQ